MTPARAPTLWLTGLSGAGKSTLARALVAALSAEGHRADLLDADQLRPLLSAGLGFSRADRDENVRRLGKVAALLSARGVVPVVAAMSPYRAGRDALRASLAPFVEIFVDAPLAVCEARDPAGVYARFRAGNLAHLSGLDEPYEPPLTPAVHCRTDRESVAECVARVMACVRPAVVRDGRSGAIMDDKSRSSACGEG